MNIEYAVQIVWSQEDGAYLAISAELPGCVADGQTPEEALANYRVVVEEWVETAKAEGRPIPEPLTVEELARQIQESEAHLKKQFEANFKSAIEQILKQLSQQQQSVMAWNIRGGKHIDPSENLEVAGGSRRH